jgi:hypothetical protein
MVRAILGLANPTTKEGRMVFGSQKLNFRLEFGLVGLAFLLLWPTGQVWAGDKVAYQDIYLSENRVCKSCRLEWVDKTKVRLVNRAGMASIVPAKAVIGIDNHPIIRRALTTSLHGIGLPGPILAPAAFEDGNDYVCKYCDSFNRF